MPAQMSLSQMLAQASQQQSVSAQNPVGNLMQSSIMQSEAMSAVGQQEISQNRLPFSPETMNQANKLHEVSNRLEHIGHVNLARQLRDSIDQAATGNAPPAWQPVSPAGLLTAVRSGQIPRGAVLPSILRIIEQNPIFHNKATMELLDHIRAPAGFAASAAESAYFKRHTTFVDTSISMRDDLNARAYKKDQHGRFVDINNRPLGSIDPITKKLKLSRDERQQRVRLPLTGISCEQEMKSRLTRAIKVLAPFQQNAGFRMYDFSDRNTNVSDVGHKFESQRSQNPEMEATQFVQNLSSVDDLTPFPKMLEDMIRSGELQPGRENLTIITDGIPTFPDKKYAGYNGMKLVGELAKQYQINITIALATNDDDVVEFYNNAVDDDNDYLAVTDQLLDELTDTIKSQGIVFREAYTEGANDLDTLYGGAVLVGDKKDECKFSSEENGQYLGYIPDTNQYIDSLHQVAAYQREEDNLHSHDVIHHTAIRLNTPPPAPTPTNNQFNNQFGYSNNNSFSPQESRPTSTSGYSTYSSYQPRLPETSNPFSRNGSIRRMFK